MSRRGEFRVSVSKDYLVFASAHFITFAGHRCEGLHGHNYRARVTIEGALDEEAWFVFDFVALKKLMRGLCDAIDHKVLLPLHNPKVQVVEDGDAVKVAYEGKPRYVFPRVDCALLPVTNTTVEMLAEMLAGQLEDELKRLGAKGLTDHRDGSRGEHRPGGDVSSEARVGSRLQALRLQAERSGVGDIGGQNPAVVERGGHERGVAARRGRRGQVRQPAHAARHYQLGFRDGGSHASQQRPHPRRAACRHAPGPARSSLPAPASAAAAASCSTVWPRCGAPRGVRPARRGEGPG